MAALDVIVVGGGLVGLSASIALARKGQKVHVLESSPSLQIVGDAIASTANHTRVLERWGLLEEFRKAAPCDLGVMQHRRYANGEVISKRDMNYLSTSFGHPSYIFSRKGYQEFLYNEALKLGVTVRFSSRVDSIHDDEKRPAVLLTDGSRFEADLIVGCDGVRSAVRTHMFPDIDCTSQTNCYRAVLSQEEVARHPDLAEFTQTLNFWMGPGRLVIQSVMADVGDVAVNLYHPGSSGTAGAWNAPGDLGHMRELFSDFDPSMQKLLGLISECISWKVVAVPSLPSWVGKGGNIIVIGDAAHGMEPYVGQGCATGMEDAAALAECVARAKSTTDLPRLLAACEKIRKPRAELIAQTASILGKVWQMPDGPGQEGRDEKMRSTPLYANEGWDGKPIDTLPKSVQDPLYQSWVMSHDAVTYANRQLDAMEGQS